jgi:aspartyl-tRNA(Asn)/glutamyl-tRNA(Gln) amidotransferase subunit A
MKGYPEWADCPLEAIATAFRDNSLSAEALVQYCISRHEAVEASNVRPPINAYKLWDPETTLAHARAADTAFAAGFDLGPLQGVPISVKDIFGVKGWPTYAGSVKRLPAKWENEGPLIQALRRQLAVLTGKTSTVEFAYGGLGLNAHWGTPRNPWDRHHHRVCGGSSSGAALSLVEGSAFLALGTDTGGSVRIPASFTGVVGLKTTKNRLSTDGIVPVSHSLDTPGILSRTVADLAYAVPSVDPESLGGASRPNRITPINLSSIRIGISNEVFWDDCSPGVAEAVKTALDELGKSGARLQTTAFPEARDAFLLHTMGGLAAPELFEFLSSELPESLEAMAPDVRARLSVAKDLTALEYLQRRRRYAQLASQAADRFDAIDVLVTPTVAISPPILSEVDDSDAHRRANILAVRNPGIVNGLGLCALTIPVGVDKSGMPVGLQIIAKANDDRRLLAIGLACEAALGTSQQRLGRPSIWD